MQVRKEFFNYSILIKRVVTIQYQKPDQKMIYVYFLFLEIDCGSEFFTFWNIILINLTSLLYFFFFFTFKSKSFFSKIFLKNLFQ